MVAFDTTALEECLTTAVKSSLGLPNNEERLKQIIKVLTIMATNKGIAASALSAPTPLKGADADKVRKELPALATMLSNAVNAAAAAGSERMLERVAGHLSSLATPAEPQKTGVESSSVAIDGLPLTVAAGSFGQPWMQGPVAPPSEEDLGFRPLRVAGEGTTGYIDQPESELPRGPSPTAMKWASPPAVRPPM